MELYLKRNGTGKGSEDKSTISDFIVNDIKVVAIEDDYDKTKTPGETRIPAGRYEIKLRTEGRIHEAYKKRFPDIHEGMLHLQDVYNYSYIYIHCGNKSEDTEGCICVGSRKLNDNYIVESTAAYKKIYPVITKALKTEEVFITITD
jgi:hypothetical protein